MNVLLILTSILISILGVLLAILQNCSFVYNYKNVNTHRPYINSDAVSAFENFIPSDENKALAYVINSYESYGDSYENIILSNLNAVLLSGTESRTDSAAFIKKNEKNRVNNAEVFHSLQAAVTFKSTGKLNKAMKLFRHAIAIAPGNADVLNEYGEFLEETQKDVITADELYVKALTYSPDHHSALTNHERTAEVVDKLDYEMFRKLDEKNNLLKGNFRMGNYDALKKQAYYLHIYHTVGIEGNTMTVEQLRQLLETGQVIGGKSLIEHNEIMGLQLAMKYIKFLIQLDYIGIEEILAIHRRIMGHVDPVNSGTFRTENVFVGSHIPPDHNSIQKLMESYVEWLNSEEAHNMHPIKYAALAHYKLVDIHPFSDGNGRTSRLVMNLILLREGYPPVMVLKEQRDHYYNTLQAANMGDVRPFIRFIAQSTLQILDMYIYGTQFLSLDTHASNKRNNELINC